MIYIGIYDNRNSGEVITHINGDNKEEIAKDTGYEEIRGPFNSIEAAEGYIEEHGL